MSSLREQVQGIVRATTAEGVEWAKYGGEYPAFDDATDRILALIAEAMLGEQVVDAAARAITSDPNFGNNTWADDARNVITAALAAAGITGAATTD